MRTRVGKRQVLALAAGIIVTPVVVAVLLSRGSTRSPPATSKRVLPMRRGMVVHDMPHTPPSAAERGRFDGRWVGQSDGARLVLELTDGLGHFITTRSGRERVAEIELLECCGDECNDFGVFPDGREERVMLWVARLRDAAREIEVWDVLPVEEDFPPPPFTLRREPAAPPGR